MNAFHHSHSAPEPALGPDPTFGYPRPQLQRTHWVNLNGRWRFAYDDLRRFTQPSHVGRWAHGIVVPYPPDSQASGIADTGFHAASWYEREFDAASLQPDRPGRRVILHFGAVDYAARVWVNGSLAVTHEGGHTPFFADITDLLGEGAQHTVTVAVFDDPHDLNQPRGKQDSKREPHAIWYPRTTGIWRTVWLECVAPTHIDQLRRTPYVDGFAFDLEVRLAGLVPDAEAQASAEPVWLDVELRHGTRLPAHDR
ncbi:MAG: hypothetical protein LH480_04025 [Rubrivivax sp.]|nr:hypothetical protein [Rubrivivax sp.]